MRPGFPGILVAVVGATVVSAAFDLAATRSIAVVGPLRSVSRRSRLPPLAVSDLFAVVPAALGIALVAATDTSVLSRTFATRRGDEVDPDREFIALGGANLATGLLSGMPVSSSASRTPVAETAGAKTQLTGVVGALAIALMLVVAPGLLAVAADLGPGGDRDRGRPLAGRRRRDGPPLAARDARVLAGDDQLRGRGADRGHPGVFIAVAVSLLEFIRRAWRPHDAVLGRADGVKGYHDLTYYPEARQVPGLILYRFDAPLFFANADVFRERIRSGSRASNGPVHWVIVAAEPITDVDTTAAAMLDELVDELAAADITLAFAEMKDPIRAKLHRYGALGHVPDDRIFPTVGTAVTGYLKATGQSWTDWKTAPAAADAPRIAPISPRGPRR